MMRPFDKLRVSGGPLVVSLSNHELRPFDKVRPFDKLRVSGGTLVVSLSNHEPGAACSRPRLAACSPNAAGRGGPEFARQTGRPGVSQRRVSG